MRGTHHQRHRFGLHLTDPAMLSRFTSVRAMQHDVAQFMGQGLHPRSRVHIRTHRHHPTAVIGQPVRPENLRRIRNQPQLKPSRLDLDGEALPQSGRCLPLQQPRSRRLRNRVTRGL